MHPSWSEQWWPVAYLRDLDRTRPQRFTLLEQDLVLWWDAPGESWRAFEDVCPHRLVPLAKAVLMRQVNLNAPITVGVLMGRAPAARSLKWGKEPARNRSEQVVGASQQQQARDCCLFGVVPLQGLIVPRFL